MKTAAQAAQEADLVAVLEFYAERKNYHQSGWQGDPEPSPVDVDGGMRARAALRRLKEAIK